VWIDQWQVFLIEIHEQILSLYILITTQLQQRNLHPAKCAREPQSTTLKYTAKHLKWKQMGQNIAWCKMKTRSIPMSVQLMRNISNTRYQPILSEAYIPLSQWCILHIPPYFHKIYRFPPISAKFINFPLFSWNLRFLLNLCFLCFPYFEHWGKMLYTYWKPLHPIGQCSLAFPNETPIQCNKCKLPLVK